MSWQQQIETRQASLEPVVNRALAAMRAAVITQSPSLREAFFYGAIGIDPKHLAVWYIFATDGDIAAATRTGLAKELERRTREALRIEGYPELAIPQIHVGLASDEAIHRAGGFRAFFA